MAFIKKIKRKWQGQEKWSVTTVTQGNPVSTKELCEYIADSTTASASDVMAVLLSLPKIMTLNLKNGRSVKLEGIGTFRYKVSAGMADSEEEAGESLIRDVRVQFTPERTTQAIGKGRIVRRALIADNLTWEIYDKPSRSKKSTAEAPSSGSSSSPSGNGGSSSGSGTGDDEP
ncbi:MAG: HU family DNA-binding protein [Bacteroidales bacterium]|nr:HU family DNA-binding protein [Bacteroidales bacterium]